MACQDAIDASFSIGGKDIERVSCTQFLEVTTDNISSWKEHNVY